MLNTLMSHRHCISDMKVKSVNHLRSEWIAGIIIVLSYFLYSFRYNATLNSDGAVEILMTYYLDFPQDLYYWGVDRWGSLVPLLAQIFYKLLHFSPINAVSVTYYLLLTGGYFGYASLLRSSFSKIIFAVMVFLPPLRFIDVLWNPVGIQYSLIGISILLLRRVNFSESGRKNYFLLVIISILFIFSQWVSDVAFITIFILVFIHALIYGKQSKINTALFVYILSTIIVGYFFIHYGKEHAISRNTNYLGFNSIQNMLESVYKITEAFKVLLLFQGSEAFMSLYTYLSIALIACLIFIFIKRGIAGSLKDNRWIYIFLINGFFTTCIAITSKWVFINDVNRRYFFGSYISLSFAFLLILDQLIVTAHEKRLLKSAFALTVLIGAISTPYYFKYVWLKSLRPQSEIYADITKLSPAGIIAGYWFSYITAAPDPSKIVATPKDDDEVRNPVLVEKVFAQPNIYIIRNDWMDLFPDTLQQFGRTLIKDGEEFTMSGCNICKYRKL